MGRIGHCRQHILQSGFNVLLQKGYNATGVKEITVAAGVPKGSFYNHFDSKESFVIEAVENAAHEQELSCNQLLTEFSGTPRERLFKFFELLFNDMQSSNFSGGCIIGNLALEMSDESENIRKTLKKIIDKKMSNLKEMLQEVNQSGGLQDTSEIEELASFVYYAWEGTVMQMKTSKSAEPYNIFRSQIGKLLG